MVAGREKEGEEEGVCLAPPVRKSCFSIKQEPKEVVFLTRLV